jgi:hypothetical protein
MGMIQLGGDADLALEAAVHIRIGQTIRVNELEGGELAELPVAGLEDGAHATFAQAVEEDIRPKQEVAAAILEQVIGLVGGEPATLQQLAGQRFRLGEAIQEGGGHLVELGGLQEAVPAQDIDQAGSGGKRHEGDSTSQGRKRRACPGVPQEVIVTPEEKGSKRAEPG